MKLKKLAFSIVLLACFSLQMSLQLHHAFEEHHAHLCDSNDIEHLCNHNIDNHEHYFDIYLDLPSNLTYQEFYTLEITSTDSLKEILLKDYQQLSFSLRAPPHSNFI